MARRTKRILEDRATAELDRAAEAGDPEARVAIDRLRAALQDGGLEAASVLADAMDRGAPVIIETKAQPAPEEAPRGRAAAAPVERPEGDDKLQRKADNLMATNWIEFRETARRKGFPKAWEELAMNMSRDAVLFVKTGHFADMGDFIQNVQRCIAGSGAEKNEEKKHTQDYRAEMDELRASLRGDNG